MPEYQASRNKAHVHDKGTFRIVGELKGFKYNINNNGAQEYKALRYYADGSSAPVGLGSGTQSHFNIYLDTGINNGSGWTGESGSEGSTAKSPTVAFMWILRFI